MRALGLDADDIQLQFDIWRRLLRETREDSCPAPLGGTLYSPSVLARLVGSGAVARARAAVLAERASRVRERQQDEARFPDRLVALDELGYPPHGAARRSPPHLVCGLVAARLLGIAYPSLRRRSRLVPPVSFGWNKRGSALNPIVLYDPLDLLAVRDHPLIEEVREMRRQALRRRRRPVAGVGDTGDGPPGNPAA